MPLYLYHATDINNLDSIMSKGLLKNPGKHNWDGMYTDDGVYLAFDADVAESYAETADVEFDEIVILRIPLNKLDQKYIEYDWNNRCEYVDDINSCVYRKDIPPNIIEITTSDNEPGQDIHDFEGTEMYDWILQTFDEEVETNMTESFCYGMKLRILETPDYFTDSGLRQDYEYLIYNTISLLNISKKSWDKVDAKGKFKLNLQNKTVLIIVTTKPSKGKYDITIINLDTNNSQKYSPTGNLQVDSNAILNIINSI